MTDDHPLAAPFEQNRDHLRGVAYRMLGSLAEAEDAVQEAWLRLARADRGDVQNLRGWLTTVVARVCLDMLRSRKARSEDPLEPGDEPPAPIATHDVTIDPEQERVLADSVGLALLVVLEKLSPAERLAFVLHDLFAVSFDEIASIVGRSPDAARQLASRARRRIQGSPVADDAELASRRQLVDTFLAALRAGDVEALVALLDPDVVVHIEGGGARGGTAVIRGAEKWARGAVQFARAIGDARPALIDGLPGLVHAPRGRLTHALRFTFDGGGKVVGVDIIAEPARLAALDVSIMPD